MRIYTVHSPTVVGAAVDDAQLVNEGFSWPAFFFSMFWALWHRLWWVALGIAAVNLFASLSLSLFDFAPAVQSVMSLAIAVLTGLMANDLRRWSLKHNGFAEVGVVAGDDAESAHKRYLSAHNTPPTIGPLRHTFSGRE